MPYGGEQKSNVVMAVALMSRRVVPPCEFAVECEGRPVFQGRPGGVTSLMSSSTLVSAARRLRYRSEVP